SASRSGRNKTSFGCSTNACRLSTTWLACLSSSTTTRSGCFNAEVSAAITYGRADSVIPVRAGSPSPFLICSSRRRNSGRCANSAINPCKVTQSSNRRNLLHLHRQHEPSLGVTFIALLARIRIQHFKDAMRCMRPLVSIFLRNHTALRLWLQYSEIIYSFVFEEGNICQKNLLLLPRS